MIVIAFPCCSHSVLNIYCLTWTHEILSNLVMKYIKQSELYIYYLLAEISKILKQHNKLLVLEWKYYFAIERCTFSVSTINCFYIFVSQKIPSRLKSSFLNNALKILLLHSPETWNVCCGKIWRKRRWWVKGQGPFPIVATCMVLGTFSSQTTSNYKVFCLV